MAEIPKFVDWPFAYKIGLILGLVSVACVLCELVRHLLNPRGRYLFPYSAVAIALVFGTFTAACVIAAFVVGAIISYKPAGYAFLIAAGGCFAWAVCRYFLIRARRRNP